MTSLPDELRRLAGEERALAERFNRDRDCLSDWIDAMAALNGKIRENIPTIVAALEAQEKPE